ncbi:MAG: hypothetical protein DRO87_07770 [Candidatus Thorarchaeota archaeon]|nr:MAG: hypothetical protein DRO87_07770 [Candidatus Thorarchaeota archaeon]
MKVRIKVSALMTDFPSAEKRSMRIPRKYREHLRVELGEYLHLKTKAGKTISLMVKPAFFVDAQDDEMFAYVGRQTFEQLDMEETAVEIDTVEGITLGCDPECIIMDSNGKVVPACDHGIGSKTTSVGHDGMLLEFRPAPSVYEEEVVDNLYNLVLRARNIINDKHTLNPNDVRLVARSHYDKVSVGFHIHFGIPRELINTAVPIIYAVNQIVKALDYYLAIPCVILEGDDYIRRSAIHIPYGKPGEYRLEYPTLEYRVLGGHLMRHPILALGALAIGAMVVEDAVSRIRVLTNNYKECEKLRLHKAFRGLYPNLPKDQMDVCKAVCGRSQDLARKHIVNILNDYEFMLTHKTHAHNITAFIESIMSNRQFGDDVEINWRTYYEQKQQGQMEIHQASR